MSEIEKNKTDKLTPRQEATIIALMTSKTIEAAAKSVNVSHRQIQRWMQEPAFADCLRRVRRETFNQSIMRILALSEKAVSVLEGILSSKNGRQNTKMKTAAIVLENARGGIELDDLSNRLEQLESRLSSIHELQNQNKTY